MEVIKIMAKLAIYGETTVTVTDGMTNEQVKSYLAAFHPELRNAEIYTDGDGNIRFRTSGGSKG